MKNATECAKKWVSLAKSLPEPADVAFPDQEDPVAILVQSFLLWETTTEKAMVGYERIMEHVADMNDLRVSMPEETAAYLGGRYPNLDERCQRLRAVLRNIYLREHEVTLESLRSEGKREIKKYVESLEGIVPYVSARLQLLGFGVHAIPVDDQLAKLLVAYGAAHEEADCAEISNWLARQVKASDGLAVHRSLQAWAEKESAAGVKKSSKKKTTKKKTASTTQKKTTKKKTKKTAKAGAK